MWALQWVYRTTRVWRSRFVNWIKLNWFRVDADMWRKHSGNICGQLTIRGNGIIMQCNHIAKPYFCIINEWRHSAVHSQRRDIKNYIYRSTQCTYFMLLPFVSAKRLSVHQENLNRKPFRIRCVCIICVLLYLNRCSTYTWTNINNNIQYGYRLQIAIVIIITTWNSCVGTVLYAPSTYTINSSISRECLICVLRRNLFHIMIWCKVFVFMVPLFGTFAVGAQHHQKPIMSI